MVWVIWLDGFGHCWFRYGQEYWVSYVQLSQVRLGWGIK